MGTAKIELNAPNAVRRRLDAIVSYAAIASASVSLSRATSSAIFAASARSSRVNGLSSDDTSLSSSDLDEVSDVVSSLSRSHSSSLNDDDRSRPVLTGCTPDLGRSLYSMTAGFIETQPPPGCTGGPNRVGQSQPPMSF